MMNAHLLRRLMAAFYDLLLVIALLFLATAIALVINGGDAVDRAHPYYPLFIAYLCVISFTYYAWFWINGGQTPGMKTWRIRLYRKDGLTLKDTMLYTLAAGLSLILAGAGFLLALVHPDRRTLHDVLTGCEMQDLRKKQVDV